MEGIWVEYFPISVYPGSNEEKSEYHSCISDDNKQDSYDSRSRVFRLLKNLFDSVILVSGISTVWEDTDGCSKPCMCALYIYLMNVLSYSYVIIMDRAINALGHGKNVVDGINATHKYYYTLP